MGSPRLIKIAILGEGGVGKSTLLEAKCYHNFNETSKMTVGVDFACVEMKLNEDPQISTYDQSSSESLLAFDLGGQERFQFLHDSYIKGIKGAIIMYDLTRYKSFDSIEKWNQLLLNENPNIPIILVGAKKDLISSKDIIDQFRNQFEARLQTFPNKDKYFAHLFISSKTFDGVEEVFIKLSQALNKN